MSGWMPPQIDNDNEPSSGPLDTPPRDGGGADADGWAGAQMDPAVIEEGNQLGAVIDVDDDNDNGGLPVTVSTPFAEPPAAPVTTQDQPVLGPISADMDPSVPTPDEPEQVPDAEPPVYGIEDGDYWADETIVRGTE